MSEEQRQVVKHLRGVIDSDIYQDYSFVPDDIQAKILPGEIAINMKAFGGECCDGQGETLGLICLYQAYSKASSN